MGPIKAVSRHAGPATFKAAGQTTINVLLAIAIIGVSFYGVWSINQQTFNDPPRTLCDYAEPRAADRANENVFLSTMLPTKSRKTSRRYIKRPGSRNRENRAAPLQATPPRKERLHDRTTVWAVLAHVTRRLRHHDLRVSGHCRRNQPILPERVRYGMHALCLLSVTFGLTSAKDANVTHTPALAATEPKAIKP